MQQHFYWLQQPPASSNHQSPFSCAAWLLLQPIQKGNAPFPKYLICLQKHHFLTSYCLQLLRFLPSLWWLPEDPLISAVCCCLTSPHTKMTNGAEWVWWLTRAPLVMVLSASGINEGDSEDCRSHMTWKIRWGRDVTPGRIRTCQRNIYLMGGWNDKLDCTVIKNISRFLIKICCILLIPTKPIHLLIK